MSHQETPARRHLMREKALFRYTSALERGDFETIAAVLHEAEADPELAGLIAEVNDTMAAELAGVQPATATKRFSSRGVRAVRRNRIIVVAAAVLTLLIVASLPLFNPTSANGEHILYLQGFALQEYSPDGIPIPGDASDRRVSLLTLIGEQLAPDAATTVVVTQIVEGETVERVVTAAYEPRQQAALPTATAAPSASPAALVEVTPAGGQGDGDTGERPVQPVEPMIVKNGEIEIVVADTNVAIERVTQVARDSGGYVLSNQAWSEGPYRSATMTIAVRVDQFETAMRRLRELAMEVVFESSSGQDVSSEYVDLQSRLRNLEATRDRIRSFLDEATTVEEALEINRQLAEIEAQIEQVQGRMQYLSGRAAFSTITITIEQHIDATATPTPTNTPTPTPTRTPTPTSPWSLGPRIENATRQQTAIFRGLLEMLTWLIIVPGPYLLITGLIILAVRALRSRRPGP